MTKSRFLVATLFQKGSEWRGTGFFGAFISRLLAQSDSWRISNFSNYARKRITNTKTHYVLPEYPILAFLSCALACLDSRSNSLNISRKVTLAERLLRPTLAMICKQWCSTFEFQMFGSISWVCSTLYQNRECHLQKEYPGIFGLYNIAVLFCLVVCVEQPCCKSRSRM